MTNINTIMGLQRQNSTPTFMEIFHDERYQLKKWWSHIQKITDPKKTGKQNTDPMWLIKLLINMPLKDINTIIALLKAPISPALNISAFQLEAYFNRQGIHTRGIYMFSFIKIVHHLMKRLDDSLGAEIYMDCSPIKDSVVEHIKNGYYIDRFLFDMSEDLGYLSEYEKNILEHNPNVNDSEGHKMLFLLDYQIQKIDALIGEKLKKVPIIFIPPSVIIHGLKAFKPPYSHLQSYLLYSLIPDKPVFSDVGTAEKEDPDFALNVIDPCLKKMEDKFGKKEPSLYGKVIRKR